MNRKLMTMVAALLLTLPLHAFAHHSAAQFNFTTPKAVAGVVSVDNQLEVKTE